MRIHSIELLLTGTPSLISRRELEALRCAGLVSELPAGSFFPGPVCQWIVANLAGLISEPVGQRECNHEGDLGHLSVIGFTEQLRNHEKDTVKQSIVITHWTNNLEIGHSPQDILRERLNLEVETINRANTAEMQTDEESARWSQLLRKAQGGLLLTDRCSPEDGPALWTMSWILSHSPSGLPIRLSELKSETFAVLGTNRVQDERIDLIASDSILRTERDGDGELICSIDFSGRISGFPTSSRSNLARISQLFRGKDFWAWPIELRQSTFTEDKLSAIFPVALPLAVFLATHAIRNARRERSHAQLSAAIEVREKTGRIAVSTKDLEKESRPNAHFYISDSGEFGIKCINSLSDLEPLPITPKAEPENVLHYAAERLGLRAEDLREPFPLPNHLREQLAMREDGDCYLADSLLSLINAAEKALANG